MKKADLYNLFAGAVEKLVNPKDKETMKELVEKYLKPKTGGAKASLEDVVKRDANGNITHVKCQLSGKWFPANLDYFYEDKTGKSKIEVKDKDGKIVKLKRLARVSEKVYKAWTRRNKELLAAKYNELLNAKTPVDIQRLQKEIEEIKSRKINWEEEFKKLQNAKA